MLRLQVQFGLLLHSPIRRRRLVLVRNERVVATITTGPWGVILTGTVSAVVPAVAVGAGNLILLLPDTRGTISALFAYVLVLGLVLGLLFHRRRGCLLSGSRHVHDDEVKHILCSWLATGFQQGLRVSLTVLSRLLS